MDFSNFEYDFKQTLEYLTKDIQEDFVKRLEEVLNEGDINSERELILKIIDMRYVDSLNICTSVLKDYHKHLIHYLENNL